MRVLTKTKPAHLRARAGAAVRGLQRPADHAPAPRPHSHVEQTRARRAGEPQDMALYRCDCGYSFKAAVTASVSCPRCGGAQAW